MSMSLDDVPHPFRLLAEASDRAGLAELLRPDVQFRSPAVHTPYQGRAACLHLLGHVLAVFENFRYTDQLVDGERAVLIFRAEIGGKELEGMDYLTTDEGGLVTELAVMVRPLSGLVALAQAMGARLEADPVPKG